MLSTSYNSLTESELSDTSRVWVYQSDREFGDWEIALLKSECKKFVEQWTAHGSLMKAELHIVYQRFIVLIADESVTEASGCSIDSSVRFFKELEKRFSIQLFDRLNIAYLQNDTIKITHVQEIERHITAGEISEDTIVFDNLIKTKGELNTHWQVPLSKTWMSRYLPVGR